MYSVVNNLKLQEGEHVYFQSPEATITDARAVILGKTYALRNVTSVLMVKREPSNTFAGFLIIIGLVIAGFSFTGDEPMICMFAGTGIILLGALITKLTKPRYIVRLGSASGESDALILASEETVQQIVDAINEAIVHRK